MNKKFTGFKARNYEFRDDENTRDVIVLFAGSKKVGFMEYSTSRQFVDLIHDLCDKHETRLRERKT